ncbi:MAG: sortase [bacterium]
MGVNFITDRTKIFRHETLLSFIILALMVLGFGIYLFLEMQVFFQEMDKLDVENSGFVPVSQEIESDFSLSINKLNLLDIPIILDIDGASEEIYLKALEGGVAHWKGTAYSGKKGNSFIFGHSEYWWNKPGNYKQVFKNLDQLVKGDEVVIKSEKRTYKYVVLENKIINPEDTEVLKQTLDYRLTLMTCWPPGSTVKRMIVTAKKL